MTEHTNEMTVDKTTSSRGAQWAGAGSLIAIAAQSLLGKDGALGNILGGGAGGGGGQSAAIAALMSENAQLKAESKTDAKLVEVYASLRAQDKAQDAVTLSIDKRLSALETAAPLREEILKGKIGEVAMLAQNGISGLQGQVTCLANTVSGITKMVVPITAVCPQPMAQYNSWTAPASTTTTA